MHRLLFTAVILSLSAGVNSLAQVSDSEDEGASQDASESPRGRSLDEIVAAIESGVPLAAEDSSSDDDDTVRGGDDEPETPEDDQ